MPDLRLAGRLWRGCSPGSVPTSRPRRPDAARSRPSVRRPAGAARPALAVRPHPAAGDRGRAAGRARRATARSTCGCRSPPRRCGRRCARGRGRAGAARRRRPPGWWATGCSPASVATPGRCSRTLAGLPAADRRRAGAGAGGAARLARRDLRANAAPDRAADACRRRRPQACRCTPATARPVRSRCCVRCCVGLLEDDPTLEPRDILVMCPDIEAYAPLIAATFGLESDGARWPSRPPAARAARRPGAARNQPGARRRRRRCSTSPTGG